MTVLDAPRDSDLSFVSTAPRHLVDRSAVAEVLLTDFKPLGGDTFLLGAQWPRGHSFYVPVAGAWYDPLLAAESLRQAAVLLGHAYYGVPLGHQSLLSELEFEVVPGALTLGPRPADVTLEISCADIRRDDTGALAAMTLDAHFLREGAFVGVGRATVGVHGPKTRATQHADGPGELPAPVPAALVGRLDERDVVLGEPAAPATGSDTSRTWQLRVDRSHPVLFDHPVAHVPGMLLIEAVRQAAQAMSAPYRVLPLGLRSAFHSYADPAAPCDIAAARLPQADAGEDTSVRVTASQSGRLVFEALITTGICD